VSDPFFHPVISPPDLPKVSINKKIPTLYNSFQVINNLLPICHNLLQENDRWVMNFNLSHRGQYF
jgi:hypothetical protein